MIGVEMLSWRAALSAALFISYCPTQGIAQDVTLTARDGSVEVSGALIGYDGEFYRVESVFGVLTIDGSGVICSGPACPDLSAYVAEIRISGAPTTTQVLIPSLIRAFVADQGYSMLDPVTEEDDTTYVLTEAASGRRSVRFVVRETTSQMAIIDLVSEEADIVLSLREVSPDEVALGMDAGIGQLDVGPQSRVVALDAIVPVVAPENPVDRISPEDLARIARGDLVNWQALGGLDAPIFLHLPTGDSALDIVFWQLMATVGSPLENEAKRHRSIADLVQAVADDPFALGIATLSQTGAAKPLDLTDRCGFPSRADGLALNTEDYPLIAPVFLYLPKRRLPAAGRDFLRFMRLPAAQHAVRRAGFADQALEEVPIAQQGIRLSNAIRAAGSETRLEELQSMLAALDGFSRLSVSFRFDGGSAALDAQSRSNISLLADAIEAGVYDGRQLIFVGFSDGEGDAEPNRLLSQARARAVRDDIVEKAATADLTRVELTAHGFGEAMPMACDDAEWGRQINRRVEVWVR